jgi:hypothetical protein
MIELEEYENTCETLEIFQENQIMQNSGKKRWNCINIFETETTVADILNRLCIDLHRLYQMEIPVIFSFYENIFEPT